MIRFFHVALFFKRADDPLTLCWVYCSESARRPDALAELVIRECPELEFVSAGETDYCVDDEYFASEGSSKGLVYLEQCHLAAYAAAFNCEADELDDDFVRRNTKRIGFIENGAWRSCPTEVVDRIPVTSTRIPNSILEVV